MTRDATVSRLTAEATEGAQKEIASAFEKRFPVLTKHCPTCGGEFDEAEWNSSSECPECESPKIGGGA